ncbi:YkgJ family cysteine cluster protein [Parasphaerochaeta coccoides]|uniref:YkgJ family cysteine cluster protein n=1 Tax=Parasphaerochaeta coccoides (strain ATCC BAA-1237 / DSM 17374 / SPN1) TaxID=760011 RepID=F4GJH7_PARC1|nr:YkgJ family cysteine cluster protein [Parasphaerochaeta coccoides]AEC02242.1 protein of unknown function UPF0153 [Parasphaerochaeta coccoides DSM 17374]
MDDIAGICARFEGTFVGWQIAELQEIYQALEPESRDFTSKFSISCPSGCGTCCERFVPDITYSEARLVAAWLILNSRSRLVQAVEEWKSGDRGCPLYNPDTPYHCTVYPVRPLVCRLFAACATKGKAGMEFRRCRFNADATAPQEIEAPALEAAGAPVMQDYAYRVRSLEGAGGVTLLPEAVLAAMDELRFILAATLDEQGPDNSNPDDTPTPTPTPLAS